MESESLTHIKALKYRRFDCETRVNVGVGGAKIDEQFLSCDYRTAHPKFVDSLPPLQQTNHLLNQYFKRHNDVNKANASLPELYVYA